MSILNSQSIHPISRLLSRFSRVRNKVPGRDKSVLVHKPLRWLSNLPDRFTRTPTATHTIVYSLPTARGMGSLRYSNSIEPLPWVRKIPWRRAWQPTPVFLPGESHGQRSLVGLAKSSPASLVSLLPRAVIPQDSLAPWIRGALT